MQIAPSFALNRMPEIECYIRSTAHGTTACHAWQLELWSDNLVAAVIIYCSSHFRAFWTAGGHNYLIPIPPGSFLHHLARIGFSTPASR